MQSDTAARTGQTDETDRLISSDKVEGTSVYNRNGDNIGTINHLMIDKISGQVEFAVMSTGGFLGIGESYSPVPWDSLVYDVNLGGYVMDTYRARLGRPGLHPTLSRIGRIVPTPIGSMSTGRLVASDLQLVDIPALAAPVPF
jgi:sporulation protein YlmC with PRC-barrel domain